MELTLGEKAKEIADSVRTMCRLLGSPVPKEWNDIQVLQYAVELLKQN